MPILQTSELTYPLTDLVPEDDGWTAGTTALREQLDWTPRLAVATADGNLVFRMEQSTANRTLAVTAGQVIVGLFTHVYATTTCAPALGR